MLPTPTNKFGLVECKLLRLRFWNSINTRCECEQVYTNLPPTIAYLYRLLDRPYPTQNPCKPHSNLGQWIDK